MNGYRLTPAAQADLSEIWDYTENRWGANQAEKYIRELQAAIERAADNPGITRAVENVRAGYRLIGAGGHVVFFTVETHGIEVVRILHQRMDPGRHL